MSNLVNEREAVSYLRGLAAIRERCSVLFDLARSGQLAHFALDESHTAGVVNRVEEELLTNYPTLNVPYHSRWRHFDAAGVNRLAIIDDKLSTLKSHERTGAKLALAIVSVLLDAGTGGRWKYTERESGVVTSRSEGLAVASLYAWMDGVFGAPCAVTGEGLRSLTVAALKQAFQVSESNPLVGIGGRVDLLKSLGDVVATRPDIFGALEPHLGEFLSAVEAIARNGVIEASGVLQIVLSVFSPIWPGRESLGGENLGDVWRHSLVVTSDCSTGLVPFHKLSQWLTYSLFEPLEEAGYHIVGIDSLTGLAEYRNGGLFVDAGVLVPKTPDILTTKLAPGSEAVVEWRALTVILLDVVAAALRRKLGKSPEELPLAKVLQGGTWSAGRKIASELRHSGVPPISIESDGTVF